MSRGLEPVVPGREQKRRTRWRRWRRRLALLAAGSFAAGVCYGVLALAERQDTARVPRGTTIDGIDVSQRSAGDAVALLRSRLGRYPPAVAVRVAHRTYRIRPRQVGVWIDYRAAVRRTLERRGHPGFVQRAWRELTSRGTHLREQAPVHVDPRRVREAVARLAREARQPRRDASLNVTSTGVVVVRSRAGIRLVHRRRLAHRVVAAFRLRRSPHVLLAATRRIAPQVTTRQVRREHPVVITVSRRQRIVRVFRHGRFVAAYPARAGRHGHRTPSGRFRVVAMSRLQHRIGFGRAGFRARGTPGGPRSVVLGTSDMRALYRQARPGATVVVGP